jgi:hypothetical protein
VAEWISVEVENLDEIDRVFARIESRSKAKALELLEGMATYSLFWLRIYAPEREGYILRHIDKSSRRWRPGGAGGGGEYEIVTGVKRGDSQHPLYVDQGTGIYGGFHRPITSTGNHPMVFFSRGRWWRLWQTKGQRPQHFLYRAFVQTRLYATGRIHQLGRELVI